MGVITGYEDLILSTRGSTLKLTDDGTDQTLTSNLGDLILDPATDIECNSNNITGVGTLDLTGAMTISANTANITHSGTTSLTVASTSGTVLVEGLTFNGTVVTGASSITSTSLVGALTGNASTATALETARTIGGTSFDGTANIVPSTITIADESSDTSCYIAYFTAATGSLQPKTGSNLTFNSSTGIMQFDPTTNYQTVIGTNPVFLRAANAATGLYMDFKRAKGTTSSLDALTIANDIAMFRFYGYDGDSWEKAAEILVELDGTPGDGDMPGQIIFRTTPDSDSGTPADALTIDSSQVCTFTQCLVDGTCEIMSNENAVAVIDDVLSTTTGIVDDYNHEKWDMKTLYQKYPYLIYRKRKREEDPKNPEKIIESDWYGDKIGAKGDLCYAAISQLNKRIIELEDKIKVLETS